MMAKKMSIAMLSVMLACINVGAIFAGGQGESGASAPEKSAATPITVGMYADLTGPTAQWGTDSEKGAKLRIKEVNASGGVLGRPIELVVYDMKASPTESVKAYGRLVQENHVCVVYGALNSNTALAVAPVAEQMKVPVVSRAMDERATTPKFNPEDPAHPGPVNPYFFLTQPSAFQQGAIIASYAIYELGQKTFASLYNLGNSYAVYLAKGFDFYVKNHGGKMLGDFTFQAGDMDYKAQLTSIKALHPDGLFIPNYVAPDANAVKQARELGLKTTFLGNNSWYKPMDELAGAAADGSYFPNNIAFDDPALQSLIAKYKAEYGQDPRLHSFSGYDDLGVIIDAIKRAGSTDPQKVTDALNHTDFQGAVAEIKIDPNTHRPIHIPMAILKFEGANIVTVDPKYFAHE